MYIYIYIYIYTYTDTDHIQTAIQRDEQTLSRTITLQAGPINQVGNHYF